MIFLISFLFIRFPGYNLKIISKIYKIKPLKYIMQSIRLVSSYNYLIISTIKLSAT